jgi:hypothetical protein
MSSPDRLDGRGIDDTAIQAQACPATFSWAVGRQQDTDADRLFAALAEAGEPAPWGPALTL